MENKRFKIYGKEINEWYSLDEEDRTHLTQIEFPYREFDAGAGFELVGTGSEDFSVERYRKNIDCSWVWVWDGVKRNKGGFRWFTCVGLIRYNAKDRKYIKAYYQSKYNAALVELR